MPHFFHFFKISCKGNKKHSNNQIKIERYDAHFNLMFIIYTCDVFNRLNAIPPHASLQFPSRPCHSPHALKGQKLLAQGTALGIHVRTPGALKGQKLYMAQGGETPTAALSPDFL